MMRVYGRIPNGSGGLTWVVVTTAPNGDNSAVFITALIQYLKLNLNESPFYATAGIPAEQSVQQGIPPDYYAQQAQQYFAGFFASLVITRIADNPPTYTVNLLTKQGGSFSFPVAT